MLLIVSRSQCVLVGCNEEEHRKLWNKIPDRGVREGTPLHYGVEVCVRELQDPYRIIDRCGKLGGHS